VDRANFIKADSVGSEAQILKQTQQSWQTVALEHPGRPIYRLETLAALVINDHPYDKLTGWSNVIPVVPVKGSDREL
jgi:hypothetical protein